MSTTTATLIDLAVRGWVATGGAYGPTVLDAVVGAQPLQQVLVRLGRHTARTAPPVDRPARHDVGHARDLAHEPPRRPELLYHARVHQRGTSRLARPLGRERGRAVGELVAVDAVVDEPHLDGAGRAPGPAIDELPDLECLEPASCGDALDQDLPGVAHDGLELLALLVRHAAQQNADEESSPAYRGIVRNMPEVALDAAGIERAVVCPPPAPGPATRSPG